MNVSTPTNGQSVTSPFRVAAIGPSGTATIKIYLDGTAVFTTRSASVDTSLTAATGTRRVTVKAWNSSGAEIGASTLHVNVTGTASTTTSGIRVSSPSDGQSVTSPFRLVASGPSDTTAMKVYLDGVSVFTGSGSQIDTNITAATGTRRITVKSWNRSGVETAAARLSVNVTGTASTTSNPPSTTSGITISSPSDGQMVSSPFRVVAAAPTGTATMKVYLDSTVVFSTKSASLDTTLTANAGSRRLTVKSWNSSGVETAARTIHVNVASATTADGSLVKIYDRIEEMDGWGHCTDCAGGGEKALYSMTQNQSSPSLDGNSTKFWIGGTVPFSHGLWWKRLASDRTSTSFVLDMRVYITEPTKSQGLEFAANQVVDGWRYKWSTQCSFGSNMWRVWDTYNFRWVDTGIACTRPPAYSWTHYVFEYQRVNGQARFVSISINGQKHYVNRSFNPERFDATASLGVHYQMNGDRLQQSYTTFVDRMKLTVQ